MRPKFFELLIQRSVKNQSTFKRFALCACLLAASCSTVLSAQTYSVIHTFTSAPDGAIPYAGLTIDRFGNLYGTTSLGGYLGTAICGDGCGSVFKLSLTASGWTSTILYAFRNPPYDGVIPGSRVVFGPDGALYGTNYEGGAYWLGAVFRLSAPSQRCGSGACPWEETHYSFAGDYLSGGGPIAEVAFDREGNLYGTTILGGPNTCDRDPLACGVVYKVAAPIPQWNQSVIHNYEQQTGNSPVGGVIFDASGNIFGTTTSGGTSDVGTIYEMTPSGDSWTYTVLYNFTGHSDGSRPDGNLLEDADGNLYGTTAIGGDGGGGTVFELSPSGGGWSFNVIHSFTGSEGPIAGLTADAGGNLYGTTYSDGAFGFGNVFKLTKSNGAWSYTSLYDFTGAADGGYSYSTVSIDAAGNLYGTAAYGGSTTGLCHRGGCGVVWEITP